jgi:hypothetical protein
MAENQFADRRFERLPIKLIMPKQGQEKRVPGGGSNHEPFREVDEKYRAGLNNQVVGVNQALLPRIRETGVAAVRVKLIPKAVAKSHRPDTLFSERTCPIIGAGQLGELFVKASPRGLEALSETIARGDSKVLRKELSCVERIEVVTPLYRRRGQTSEEVLSRSPRRGDGYATRVTLFNFGDERNQNAIIGNFINICESRGVSINTRGYALNSLTCCAICRTVADLEALSQTVGVRAITRMPLIRTIRPQTLVPQSLPVLAMRDPNDSDVPVVVVVDSGISSKFTELNSWILGRDAQVPKLYENTAHGTFVAGLIAFGGALNPTINGIDGDSCGVFDLQVIPNDDPSRGDIGTLLESELLISLENALQEHANKYKVWNLSLGTDAVCSLDEFSPLAVELDNLQERFQVSFVLSAGNYVNPPLLDFPRSNTQIEPGRITSPADSVLGITVGAISHVDFKTGGPKMHHPSPFSRHGAGPNYIIKPDLVHYGGSCSTDGALVHGIRSLTEDGLAEDLGTSFSTPLVSRSLAQLYHQITPVPSPVMARSLLTHHARDPRTGNRVPDNEENYFGFGLPASVPTCLECSPHTATLVFEESIRPGYYLEWDNFPYPPSLLRNGKYFGEVWMTLAFAPSRGERWGSEYCETHIDAHLGVYRNQEDKKTGAMKQKFFGLVPPEHKNDGILLYETFQVASLRKWAPVRTYYGDMGPNGMSGLRWRLMLRLLTRHGIERNSEVFKPQHFALIITIADPNKTAPVYDEVVQIVRNKYQAQNIGIRSRTRVRAGA